MDLMKTFSCNNAILEQFNGSVTKETVSRNANHPINFEVTEFILNRGFQLPFVQCTKRMIVRNMY